MTLHRSLTVGTPVPQGSKSVTRTGRLYEANKRHKAWRATVAASVAAQHDGPPIDQPIRVQLTFVMPRPKRPRWHVPAVKPDADKLARSVLDSMQAGGVIVEDSRVVDLHVTKIYTDALFPDPGVVVSITPA